MTKLEQIYFDGQSYAKHLVEIDEKHSQDEIDFINSLNLIPIDSISFKKYHPKTFCDISIGDYYFQGVSITYLYTDIQNKTRTILYPSHNPSPDPGGLY
jgi:hypothetical protein